jgi:hypothetical protein
MISEASVAFNDHVERFLGRRPPARPEWPLVKPFVSAGSATPRNKNRLKNTSRDEILGGCIISTTRINPKTVDYR